MRARTRVARADDVEALRLPRGCCDGAGGPITWLPTLNRVREGLQRQGLRRVVTDTPVTTRAVAKATRESGASAYRACLTALASRNARGLLGGSGEVRRTDAGFYGPIGRVSPGRRSSRRPVAPWEQLGARPMRDRGPLGTSDRSTTGRASSSDHAAKAL